MRMSSTCCRLPPLLWWFLKSTVRTVPYHDIMLLLCCLFSKFVGDWKMGLHCRDALTPEHVPLIAIVRSRSSRSVFGFWFSPTGYVYVLVARLIAVQRLLSYALYKAHIMWKQILSRLYRTRRYVRDEYGIVYSIWNLLCAFVSPVGLCGRATSRFDRRCVGRRQKKTSKKEAIGSITNSGQPIYIIRISTCRMYRSRVLHSRTEFYPLL